MKHKILTIIALILLVNQVNAAEKSIYSPRGHYRIPLKSENVETFEGGGYENLLRMVDEYNRQRGINRSYFYKSTNKELRLHDNIDLIPVTQYTGDEEHGNYGTAELDKKNSLTKGYLDLPSIIEKGTEALKQNGNYEDFSYTTKGNKKRFYFGNGNVTNDIIIKGTNEFNKELELQKNAKTDKYLIDGKYESINYSNRNQLGITMDEYYKRIEGKSNDEVRQFLLEKLKEKRPDLNIYEKDGELYTKENGQEWKVYYKVEPVSVERTSTNGQIIKDNEKFEDTVYTNIYVYKPNNDPQNSAGRVLYTSKRDIIVEDKLNSNTEILINTSYERKRSLQDIINFAESGKILPADASENEKNIYRYIRDKENVKNGAMSQSDFDAKWVTPFGPGSTFQNDIQEYMRDVVEKEKELEILKKEYEDNKKKWNDLQNDPDFIALGYMYIYGDPNPPSWITQADIEWFESRYSKRQVQLAKDFYKYKALTSAAGTAKTNKELEIHDLAKRYGFFLGSTTNPAENKWVGKFLQNSHISLTKTGKKIEFRGQGKILGKVDLGEGENELLISEASTGRFGTNIILGPYSSLHGIKILRVGGKSSANEGNASLSGRTSLTLDLDPTKKNDEGHLYQHALKDSDPNIVFIEGNTAIERTYESTNPMKNRNQFEVELMVSRISENSTIDMGRNIHYTYTNKILGESWDMNIPFISDSIAHSLVDNHKYSKNGNSLLEVKIKNEIKRLDQDENEVYRSIKNANLLSLLQPTLTTTNKKTKFSVKDEKKEESKKLALFDYLIEKKPEDIIKDLSDFNLDKDKEQEAVDKINKLQSSPVVLSTKRKLEKLNELHQREEYKNIDLGKFINPFAIDYDITIPLANISEVWTDYDEFYQKDLGYRNSEVGKLEEKRIEKRAEESLKRIKSIVDKIDKDTLTNLATQYPEAELGSIVSLINDIKALNNTSQEGMRSLYNKVIGLKKNIDKQLAYKENLLEELEKSITLYSGNEQTLYNNLRGIISYTLREEEALQELKELLSQLKDTNIYSKVNKIAKNEISTYTNIPFDINRSLSENKHYTRGGFISNRTVQDNFKGNIYTAYGLYEKTAESGTKYGFMIGGANTKHNEVYQRSLTTVATESDIKGVSAYVGGYFNKPIINNLNWITGVGAQYGTYKVRREMRNNYQDLHSEGKVNTNALNTYSGLIMNYPIQEDVFVQLKALLAYTMVKQSKVNESGDLPLDISAKTYHYVDGEAGISFNKIFYGDNLRSSISAGAYGITGLAGYKNGDMDAKIDGSTSSFGIKGDRIKKDAVKINLDYNVQTDIGYNYGLEGTYISNSKENNVKIGIKAGYIF